MLSDFFGATRESAAAEQDNSGKPLIVITGVTGFIGSQLLNHCVKNLSDNYQFRGTVRNPMDTEKMAPLHDWFGGAENLTAKADIVHADLNDE